MLKGRTIVARPQTSASAFVPPKTPATSIDDPFSQGGDEHAFDITTSSPLCKQVFNIFHPTDPISYRIEPLISPAMSALKAQPLPYTKKGIFGAPASQGFTGIGQRVGQGVTDFWTSLGSGKSTSRLGAWFVAHWKLYTDIIVLQASRVDFLTAVSAYQGQK
jgi:hypothetical protein